MADCSCSLIKGLILVFSTIYLGTYANLKFPQTEKKNVGCTTD